MTPLTLIWVSTSSGSKAVMSGFVLDRDRLVRIISCTSGGPLLKGKRCGPVAISLGKVVPRFRFPNRSAPGLTYPAPGLG
jgi:hypothetical protein